MKALTMKGARRTKQSGFTIIELVVVILLLGILTATALPRFMDVTDEAHQAVVDATIGGLGTASALFRAQWTALGEPITAITEFGSNFAHTTSGYPIGTNASGTVFNDALDCIAAATGILQTIGAVTFVVASGGLGQDLGTTVASTSASNPTIDYIVIRPSDDTDTCEYWYVSQTAGVGATPYIIYDASAGTLVESSATPPS